MKCDVLIKNGLVIDPAENIYEVMDVAIGQGKILCKGKITDSLEAKCEVLADGCIVTPGLIDSHVHCFDGGNESGMDADMICPPSGITTVIDGGSAGVSNFEIFSRAVIQPSKMRIKAFLTPSPAGQAMIHYYPENMDPHFFDLEAMLSMQERHPHEIVAVKMRISKNIVGELGLAPLKAAISIAEKMHLPVVVHTTNPAGTVEDVLNLLRPGDVYCHAFHGVGNTIIGDDGGVLSCVKAARERGVIFDVANGVGHFSFSVAQAALADGFFPDTISTDMGKKSMNRPPVRSLSHVISKYLNMGMPLADVIRACTATPSRVFHLEDGTGSLRTGSRGDVAIFKLCDKEMEFVDTFGKKMAGQKAFIPQMTVLNGNIVFRQTDF